MSLAQRLLFNLPSLLLCAIMVAAAVALSVCGTLLTQRFIHHSRLKLHNDISGPIFNTLGVIYAVLLAFVVIIVWQKFDRVRTNMEMEVNCLANLYIDAEAFREPFKQEVRSHVRAYTREIIKEWEMLAKGKGSPAAKKAIEKLFMLYSGYSPEGETEKAFFEESIDKVNELLDLRILRLIEAGSGIHYLLWLVLIAGGVITISFTIFFGSESLGAKILMSTLLAILIALVLFTTLEFSFPFTGVARIPCKSFEQLLMNLET